MSELPVALPDIRRYARTVVVLLLSLSSGAWPQSYPGRTVVMTTGDEYW